MAIGLQIEVEEVEQKIVLRLSGRIDAMSSSALEKKIQTLVDEGRFQLLLDFTSVDYLSSAGMRVLLAALKKVKAKQGFLILFSLSDDVDEVIRLAGFDKVFHILPNEKEALQYGI
ncbi:MAG: STAS domain-containing protein [Chlamydiales bacterium]|nr:STAS domain-containing protein [Chlamydiales bacterium]